MGLIHLPRAYFQGFTYWNPSTMNNNDYQPVYDPATARLNWPWLQRHGLKDAQDFDRYAITPTIPTANASADTALVAGKPPAEWNYHGGNECGFVGPDCPLIEDPQCFAKPAGSLGISGYTDPAGTLVQQGDPWIGLPLRMSQGLSAARLVDVDPVCPWSTQIFADAFTLGSAQTGAGFTAQTAQRAHSRWVFFARNFNLKQDLLIAGVGAAAWQFGLPSRQIEWFGAPPAAGSLAAHLQQALAQPGVQGLMLRFVTYMTVYFQGPAFPAPHGDAQCFAEIARIYADYADRLARFKRGELLQEPARPANRAYSRTVGWFAPWRQGELASMPGGRFLATQKPAPVIAPAGVKRPALIGPAVVEVECDPAAPNSIKRLCIDLGSSIPELDSSGAKVDCGSLMLGLTEIASPGAPVRTIAAIPYVGGYDQAAYQRSSGIVEIPASAFVQPVSAADLGSHLLMLWFDSGAPAAPTVLQELPLVAQTDDRGVYLNQPDPPWPHAEGDERSVRVQLRWLGGKPLAGTRLGVAQYSPATPGFNEMDWALVDDAPNSTAQAPYALLIAPDGSRSNSQLLLELPFADDGLPWASAEFGLRGLRPGPPILGLYPLPPGPPGPVWAPPAKVAFMDIANAFFAVARVLPFHNAMALEFENWLRTGPTIDIVGQRVFDDVFSTFCLMYPAMRFLGDPLRFQAWRGPILALTDPALFERGRYMPVMRNLSAGQRRMLALWTQYTDGDLPTPPKAPAQMRRG